MKVQATQQTAHPRPMTQTAPPGGELGKEAFLKILLAQMRNQDPLNPADSTAMIAQLAQFSSLEQMQNLNNKIDQLLEVQLLGELSGLVGRNVTFSGENDEVLQGTVQSLIWNGNRSQLRIDDMLIPLGRVLEVKEGQRGA
ncbi:MAG: Basal-body rod modification protein FlgD [Firmicutes bacterium]|nr:Basal-body rod modification protein FlgD [Bacillota bacterium]